MTDIKKLPEMKSGMPVDQACLIETYTLLVRANIITEELAAQRYWEVQKKFGNPERWVVE